MANAVSASGILRRSLMARVRHVRVLVVRWASGRRALRSWFWI